RRRCARPCTAPRSASGRPSPAGRFGLVRGSVAAHRSPATLHSQNTCLTVSGLPHPDRGKMKLFAVPRGCITALTGRVSWAAIHDQSLCLFWRAGWATFLQPCLAPHVVGQGTGLTFSRSCTRETSSLPLIKTATFSFFKTYFSILFNKNTMFSKGKRKWDFPVWPQTPDSSVDGVVAYLLWRAVNLLLKNRWGSGSPFPPFSGYFFTVAPFSLSHLDPHTK